MTRALIIVGLALALAGAAYWMGGGKLRERILQDQIEVNERIDNADVGEGDPVDDGHWVDDFIERLRPGSE